MIGEEEFDYCKNVVKLCENSVNYTLSDGLTILHYFRVNSIKDKIIELPFGEEIVSGYEDGFLYSKDGKVVIKTKRFYSFNDFEEKYIMAILSIFNGSIYCRKQDDKFFVTIPDAHGYRFMCV